MPSTVVTPLAAVGTIAIGAHVMNHRFVREALACATLRGLEELDRVVGTANTGKCELYGWGPHVSEHTDGFGYIYVLCLNDGRSSVCVRDGEEIHEVFAPGGQVLRLDDRFPHWTADTVARVAAFVGQFDTPRDAEAMRVLEEGVAELERGTYYGAPRVREGFRALLEDECLAASADMESLDVMLLDDARRAELLIERCALCAAPAIRADHYWPYSSASSRCAAHLNATEAP